MNGARKFGVLAALFAVVGLGIGSMGLIAAALGSSQEDSPLMTVDGVIYPTEERELAFSTSGLITHSRVEQGDTVEQGQRLFELESDLNALEVERRRLLLEDITGIKALEQRSGILNTQYASLQRLFSDTGSVSRDELISLQLQVLETRSQLEGSRFRKKIEATELEIETALLEQTRLTSPISGVITDVLRQPGEWTSVGDTVVRVVDMSEVILRISVAYRQTQQLRLGQQLLVNVETLGMREGVVDRIATVADPASSRVWVHIKIDNPEHEVMVGTRASVQF